MAEQDHKQELVYVMHIFTVKPLSETSILIAPNAKGIMQASTF